MTQQQPFASKHNDRIFVARFRDTYATGRGVHTSMTNGGAISLMTDFVRAGRYLRYSVLDTAANRAAVRSLGGTVKPQ